MPESTPSGSKPAKLLFVVTEDWFFASHFLPMARAAIAAGFQVAVVTRVTAHGAAIEALGARVIPVPDERAARGPLAALRSVRRMAAIFRAERPDILHLIALKPVVLGGLAARVAGIERRIYAVTGLGILDAGERAAQRLARSGLRKMFRWGLAGPRTHYLFENEDDPVRLLPAATPPERITIVGGAGVDLAHLPVAPMASMPPLRVAVVARMLWQKGIDVAVEAVRLARAEGAAVELSLYGTPDPANPRAIPIATLEDWSRLPGVRWHGRSDDIPAVWAAHHVCCLPSRGGEGLPRSILEGAACGRPVVTTDVPGCRSFVREGIDGLVVPPDNPAALAQAFITLARDPDGVARMGASARARVTENYTEEAVARSVAQLYARLLSSR